MLYDPQEISFAPVWRLWSVYPLYFKVRSNGSGVYGMCPLMSNGTLHSLPSGVHVLCHLPFFKGYIVSDILRYPEVRLTGRMSRPLETEWKEMYCRSINVGRLMRIENMFYIICSSSRLLFLSVRFSKS
eukprot:Rmarinus@m.17023